MEREMERARRAYEAGRVAFGLRHATGALILAGLAVLLRDDSPLTLAVGVLVVLGQGLAAYAHHDYLRGAWLGLGLGASQLTSALFMTTLGMRYFPEWCMDICFALVLSGSIAVGLCFARLFAHRPPRALARGSMALVAMGVPMVVVCCAAGGAGLLTGSAIGLTLGAAPGWVWRSQAA